MGLAAAAGEFAPSVERAQRQLNFAEFKGFVEGLLAAFQIDGPKWRAYDGMGLVPPGAVEVTVDFS